MNRLVSLDAISLPPSTAQPLVLNLFGPPRVCYQGQPLDLPRRQTRALLYRLGATLEPMARADLATLFWPEADDLSARRNVARLLSLVRDHLPDSKALDITTSAVSLDPQRVWSDANRLMQLERQETPSAWQQMADLYGGPFLAGFLLHNNAEYELWQMTMVEHLRLRCLEALSKLIDYNITRGEYTDAIHYAQRYLSIDSLAENIHRQLIGLYVMVGERGRAQRQFEECVAILERELGVDPLPETRAAYDRTRLHQVSTNRLKSNASPRHVSSTIDLPLIGRRDAWQQLENAYAKLKDGGMILISGEPGIGKSRLMHEYAAEQNALVISGRCLSDARTLALHPVVEALRPALPNLLFAEHFSGSVWLTEAEPLLPELRTIFPCFPEAIQPKTSSSQLRQFEALFQVLLGLADNLRVILCLDDLHWSDESTLLWLQYVSNRLYASRICICATYCAQEADTLARLRRNLLRNGLLGELQLAGLGEEGVTAIVEVVANQKGQPIERGHAAATATRLCVATAGNAYYVLEIVRALAEMHALAAPPQPLPIPPTVRNAIEQRVAQLTPVAQQVLEAAALLDAHIEFQAVLTTSGRSEIEVSDSLHELVCHDILEETVDGLRFRHALFRQVVSASIAVWRRQMLAQRRARAESKH